MFKSTDGNEVILGASGSGKTYVAKDEIRRIRAEGKPIFIIDAFGEYNALVKNLGGAVVDSSSDYTINPLDLTIRLGEESGTERNLESKATFLINLVNLIGGEKSEFEGRDCGELIPIHPSDFDKATSAIKEMYLPYIAECREKNVDRDISIAPTLKDLKETFAKAGLNGAALTVELVEGLSFINKHTYMPDSDLVSVNLGSCGERLRNVYMFIAVEHAVRNAIRDYYYRKKQFGSIFIEEIQRLFYHDLVSEQCVYNMMVTWFKLTYKYGYRIVGITQDVDLFDWCGIEIEHLTETVIMLKMCKHGRQMLVKNGLIGKEQADDLQYDNCEPGEGYIRKGDVLKKFKQETAPDEYDRIRMTKQVWFR